MEKYIVFNLGDEYKNYEFVQQKNDLVFTIPYMTSDDGRRYFPGETTLTIENAVNLTHIELLAQFSIKIKEFRDGYLLG